MSLLLSLLVLLFFVRPVNGPSYSTLFLKKLIRTVGTELSTGQLSFLSHSQCYNSIKGMITPTIDITEKDSTVCVRLHTRSF